MSTEDKLSKQAEAECDAQVREQLQKGIRVSAKEWIAMGGEERKKVLYDAKILASFW